MYTPPSAQFDHTGMKVSYLFFFAMGAVGLSGVIINSVPLMLLGMGLGLFGVSRLPKSEKPTLEEDLARIAVRDMAAAIGREQDRERIDQAKYAEWVRFSMQHRLQFREQNHTDWLSHNLQYTMEKIENE